MAALACRVSRKLIQLNCKNVETILKRQNVMVNSTRNVEMFRHLAVSQDHDTNYEYEVTNDPNEWKHVERLMPLKTVPQPTPKSVYPSGWRPMKEEALKLPYFVERSKNHMLSVYLDIQSGGQLKITLIKRIYGDIWGLHDEVKAFIEERIGKPIASCVHEGNCTVSFKGDHVYHVEEWMLSKGF